MFKLFFYQLITECEAGSCAHTTALDTVVNNKEEKKNKANKNQQPVAMYLY